MQFDEMGDVPRFTTCPRCADEAWEVLPTYAHCVACLYSEDTNALNISSYVPNRTELKQLEKETKNEGI